MRPFRKQNYFKNNNYSANNNNNFNSIPYRFTRNARRSFPFNSNIYYTSRFNTNYNKRSRRQNNNLQKPKFRYKFTKKNKINDNRLINNNNSGFNNNTTTRAVKQLENQINSLTITKPTNLMPKNKKQIRNDKVITAMEMALKNQFLSYLPTTNRIVNCVVYSKVTYTIPVGGNYAIWFPYAVNFSNYQGNAPIVYYSAAAHRADRISTFLFYTPTAQTLHTQDTEVGLCSIPGIYRLNCATLKVYNTTSMMQRSGDYTIYKLDSNNPSPAMYVQSNPISYNQSSSYKNTIDTLCTGNYLQTAVKNNFSASDKFAKIDEININEGNNIFCATNEYLGNSFINRSSDDSANFTIINNNNPVGINTKYLIKFSIVTEPQTYVFESWQVLQVVPAPELGLGNIAHVCDLVATKNVIEQVKYSTPFNKL